MSGARRGSLPARSELDLRQRQERGQLRVRAAAAYRSLVQQAGLAEAYATTDVVVAADAGFSDQASLHLSLGPTDPPIRLRDAQLAGVAGLASGGPGELVLPIGGGLADPQHRSGAQILAALLQGERLPLDASGEATAQHPRRELHTALQLAQVGGAGCFCSGRLWRTASWRPAAPPASVPAPGGPCWARTTRRSTAVAAPAASVSPCRG